MIGIRDGLPTQIPGLSGKYTIELKDEKRGTRERIESKNYITPLWANYARWLALQMPAKYWGFPYDGGSGPGSALSRGEADSGLFPTRSLIPTASRPFPWQSVILTDDATTEDTADHWLRGQMVAYGTMWKAASVNASGQRGQINEAECTVTTNGQVWKWVWDWTTQQGNGTYQTVGMGMVIPDQPTGRLLVGAGPHGITGPTVAEIQAVTGVSGLTPVSWAPFQISNGKLFFIGYNTTSIRRVLIADVPVGLWTDDFDGVAANIVLDATGLTWTNVGGNNPGGMSCTSSSGTGASFYQAPPKMFYDTTTGAIFYAENWTNGQGEIGRMSTAGANTWQVNPFGGSGFTADPAGTDLSDVIDLVVIADKVYVSCLNGQSANLTKLTRHSVATGAYEANVPLPSGYTVQGGMTTDGTDLFIWTNLGILQMTTTGTYVMNWGWPVGHHGANIEQGSSPWTTGSTNQNQARSHYPGSYQIPLLHPISESGAGSWFTLGHTTYFNQVVYPWRSPWRSDFPGSPTLASNVGRRLYFANSRLWMSAHSWNSGAGFGRYGIIGITGANCLSRTLLDTSVTKSASQTMKVSYELTLPDPDANWHTHIAVA